MTKTILTVFWRHGITGAR